MKTKKSAWEGVRAERMIEGLEGRVLLSGGGHGAAVPTPVTVAIGSISGNIFNDANGDGVKEHDEHGVGGVTVTIQQVRGGKAIGHALTTTTDGSGHYSFRGLVADTYRVTPTLAANQTLTAPATGAYTIALAAGEKSGGNNFGDFRPVTPIYAFTTLDDPKAAPGVYQGTWPSGISGQIVVGGYFDSGYLEHGFIYNIRTGKYTTLDDPRSGGYSNEANGISGSIIVGDYLDSNGLDQGFIYNLRTGIFSTLDDPNGGSGLDEGTMATGISGNTIVGDYIDAGHSNHGFIYNDITGVYATLDDPNAGTLFTQGTFANGISGNTVVGDYFDSSGSNHGFIYDDATGVYTTLDYPKDYGGTNLWAVAGNTIVGDYSDHAGNVYGFIYDGRSVVKLDDPDCGPGLTDTEPYGISGTTIVGYYADANGLAHGFIATPATTAPPASIRGTVFNDRNGDGTQEGHDRGISGVTITLQQFRRGNPIGFAMTTTTDASGHYSFDDLAAGTYSVTQTPPAGYTLPRYPRYLSRGYLFSLVKGEDSFDNDFGDHQKGAPLVKAAKGSDGVFAAGAEGGLVLGREWRGGVFAG